MMREKFKKLRKIKQRLQSYIEKINTMMKHPKIALDFSMYVNDKNKGSGHNIWDYLYPMWKSYVKCSTLLMSIMLWFNFVLGLIFIFLTFLCMVMCGSQFETKEN